jgi:hypothetical protein
MLRAWFYPLACVGIDRRNPPARLEIALLPCLMPVAKQPNQRVVDWVDAQTPETLYLSVITIGEIAKGINGSTIASPIPAE